MPKSKKLQNQIEKKLDTLQELLDNLEEVRVIDSNDPETWDSDSLYNLAENCKDILKILEDQPLKDKKDEFGQPLTEDGLCSLIDSYQEEAEEDNEGY